MKKFFVGLLSIFLFLGVAILTACGAEKPVLTLSQDSVEIELYSGDTDGGYQTITADVSGVSDKSISVSGNGYEQIIKLVTQSTTEGKTLITIYGLQEGYAEFVVMTNQGNAFKVVTVEVYSEVSAMQQKVEETTKKNNYAIRGQSVTLIENNLLTFEPSQNSRRTITWELATGTTNASINGNILTILDEFDQESITLQATTEKGVTTIVTLPVLDKIENDISFEWSYSQNSDFELISEDKQYLITPNLPEDDYYEGYISLNYEGDLDITPVITTKLGVETNGIIVVRQPNYEGKPLFLVYANKNVTANNEEYIISFKIGYSEYNYSIETLSICPIHVIVREKVNDIRISTDSAMDVEGSEQIVYTDYASSSEKGKEFVVNILPTTVKDATNKYSISISRRSAGESIADGSPVEIWYRDTLNGNIWVQIPLMEDESGNYVTDKNNLPSVKKIYIKASETLKLQSVDGITLTFTSADNSLVSTYFDLKLIRSVSEDDFVFENADFRVDSSKVGVIQKKTFTLQGQTSIEGLSVINNSSNVTISQPKKVNDDDNSVTFEITLTLNNTSQGITSLDSYQIAHANGLLSENFSIDIFLPLKSASVVYNTSNESNSVSDIGYSNKLYSIYGEVLDENAAESVSKLMLKNGSTTPILYSYNTSNGQSAVAKLSISYYDFVETETNDITRFKNLINTSAGISEIINKSKENVNQISSIANFTYNNSNLVTKSVGFTYAVLTFSGKGVEKIDEDGNTSLVRIIFIESYISPEGLVVTPQANKQVTLYANDTVGDRDKNDTTKRITIQFPNSNITYYDILNFDFVSTTVDSNNNAVMGDQSRTEKTVTWTKGRYAVTEIVTQSNYISFNIEALTTMSDYAFYDTLMVHYILKTDGQDGEKLITDIYTPIKITIKNAQRVEQIVWSNSDKDGIYFEVGSNQPYYMLLQVSPTNSKNNNVTYVVTDENGEYTTDFVSVSNNISMSALAVNLPSMINEGMNGFVYVLPEDAVYNNQIKYYYIDENTLQEKEGYLPLTSIGNIKDTQTKESWYDFLVNHAYFKSITTADNMKTVDFSNILIRAEVIVADGRSFEHSYRVYDANGFVSMKQDRYYTVMNSIDLTDINRNNEEFSSSFNGGLQGYSSEVTIKFAGKNLSNSLGENATIRNLSFNGHVSGNGFIVDFNYGTISNVTVDVYERYSSVLTATTGEYVGGIVGQNFSLIEFSKVLGLTIDASFSDSIVGGISGLNSGDITNCQVEFYNLEDYASSDDDIKYSVNTFKGSIIGGIVGEVANSSNITKSFAYNYNLTDSSSNVFIRFGSTTYVGAFAGIIAADVKQAIIDYSFSVIGINQPYNLSQGATNSITFTNYYYSYYQDGEYISKKSTDYQSNPNFVKAGDENFLEYVNNGDAHLKELYQDEEVNDVKSYSIKTTDITKTNGFYKSIAVNSNNGILFNYKLKSNPTDLTSTQENDLNELNTITLSELIGNNSSNKNIIISSSDSSIVKVVGTTINIKKTGNVVLTLSSKQNVENFKTINVKVVYAISNMVISWTDITGSNNIVEDESLSYLQKTKSRDYVINFEKTKVILGNTAESFDLVSNDSLYIKMETTSSEESAVAVEKISNNVFKVFADNDSTNTTVTVKSILFENDLDSTDVVYQDALNNVFERKFYINPTDGVITFDISDQQVSITPSTNATIKVQIETTAVDDEIIPLISYDGNALSLKKDENMLYHYSLTQDNQTPILDAVVSLIDDKIKSNGVYIYIFEVNLSVNMEYKSKVSDDMIFEVSFKSKSGNDSKDLNSSGTFELLVTKQNFNSIDVNNTKITNSIYTSVGNNSFATVHIVGDKTSVLAPGNSSILSINVNPYYAYYDYVELSYSGSTVSYAVDMELVKPYASGNIVGFIRATNSNIQEVGTTLRYTPSNSEKSEVEDTGVIYFKIWINPTVNSDSIIKFTAKFCKGDGSVISYVNYFLSVSYLKEPSITVDGNNTAYVAKGSTAKVDITVLMDQSVESPIIIGEEVKGINISDFVETSRDEEKGTKTFSATLTVTVLASVDESQNNTFYIQAKVSRDLNGVTETKSTRATVILVDFKIDPEKIEISNSDNGTLDVWVGVPKAFDVNYNLVPQNYNYDEGDDESVTVVEDLLQSRQSFTTKQYYPSEDKASTSKYLINYIYDTNKNPVVQTLKDRLFYVVGENTFVNINDSSVDSPISFSFDSESNNMVVTGKRLNNSINLVLRTYISAGGLTAVYDTYFTITVKAYSDPDLPLTISSTSDFNDLNPALYDKVSQNDYILTNDIVLTGFTPFDTSMIRSFDGNGYTIYIKSFNVEPDEQTTLNLALFNNVVSGTTLKNVRVNLYNGGQLTIDVSKYKTINIAGLALNNEGIITNCEIVSFYSEDYVMNDVLSIPACEKHNYSEGINIKFVRGKNTSEEVYITQNSDWSSSVAGFVLTNKGSITNSRVGGDSIIIIGSEKTINNLPTGYTSAQYQDLGTFNIVGQGNIAGFVLNNNGSIASSFVKKVDISNKSQNTTFYTAGFVGVNSQSIITSYIEGVKSSESELGTEYSAYAYEGSSLKSDLGYIAGFVYNNNGFIKDAYSNILIANSYDTNKVYLASGFVYINSGEIENAYSASQIANSKFTQMNFSGVDEEGNLRSEEGVYTNCYFFNKAYESATDTNDTTTESRFGTGAILVTNPSDTSAFYGFAFADGENDGVWRTKLISAATYVSEAVYEIQLIETNTISHSHRYIYHIDDSNYDGIVAEDENGKYILPYSILQFDDGLEIDTYLGSSSNPILIADFQDFIEISGKSSSSYIQNYYNDEMIWGNYRLVNDIDLSQLISSDESVVLPSTQKCFAGKLYGNGFDISGISIASESEGVTFGLFASMEGRNGSIPLVTNLNISIDQIIANGVVMVGGLAGYIKDSIIINVDFNFSDNASIEGLNFVGALSGFAFGNNIVKNISVVNPTLLANRYIVGNLNDYLNLSGLKSLREQAKNTLNYSTKISDNFVSMVKNYSFAGSVIGFVDNYNSDSTEFNINQSDNFSINNIRVSGIVNIKGQVVGGLFGLTGYQTNIRDIGITIEGSKSADKSSNIVSTKYFAGGVIGQSFGSVSRAFAVHNTTIQNQIENNLSNFYNGNTSVERGVLDLFVLSDENYNQKAIGGLIGYVGSGKLEISYSKLNVISLNAEYAGGLIGFMDLSQASAYQTNAEYQYAPAYTKYLINEAYASGDVRASVKAGGLIGAIRGEASRVALLSVNALNYFTAYDYDTGIYEDIKQDANLSKNYKFNLLVGDFIKVSNSTDVVDSGDSYSSYLTLMQAKEDMLSGGVQITNKIASIAYYQNYIYNGFTVKLNLIEGKDNLNINLNDKKEDYVYQITSSAYYNSAETGRSYTQEAFLNSGIWSQSNWTHPTDQLFPSIKYQRATNYLYLDCYNVKEVFDAMSNGEYTVVVRGLVSEGSEEVQDIDLGKYEEDYKVQLSPITGFSGKIIGGQGESKDIKIIAYENFITSVGKGFSMENVNIQYKLSSSVSSSQDNNNIELTADNGRAGLLIASEVREINLSNVNIEICNPVSVTVSGDNVSVGLIAPKIISSSIANLKISYIPSITNDGAIFNVKLSSSGTTASIGLITGEFIQESSISIMQIEGIKIELQKSVNYISVTNEEGVQPTYNSYYIGTYAGLSSISTGAQDLRMSIRDLVGSENAGNTGIALASIKQQNPNEQNVKNNDELALGIYLGGYIGLVKGLGVLSTFQEEAINVDFNFMINNVTADTIYTGLFIGQKKSNSYLNINGHASIVDGKLLIDDTSIIQNLYAGGIVGYNTSGSLNISQINTINFEVRQNANNNVNNSGWESLFKTSYSNSSDVIKIINNVNIGIVLGFSDSPFTFLGANGGTNLNSGNGNIKVQVPSSGEINIGSVIGSVNISSGVSINIQNEIIAKPYIFVEFVEESSSSNNNNLSNDVNIGGIIGKVIGGTSEVTGETSDPSVGINGGNSNKQKIRFDGAIFSNVSKLNFGGVVGDANSVILKISNTSFGGVLKIWGASSNSDAIIAGGTLGHTGDSLSVKIENNYNYGDVFVENSGELGKYAFGGLIGFVSTSVGECANEISENYSIVTSFNSRYNTSSNTAHALFGEGDIKKSTDNYYNHEVSLLTDDSGYDIGYTSGYSNKNGYNNAKSSDAIASIIINNVLKEGESISKLDPTYIHTGNKDNDNSFHGIKYYEFNSTSFTDSLGSFENSAIIGQRGGDICEIDYTNNDGSKFAFIEEISGYSFVSGVVVNVDINIDNGSESKNYAGLVSEVGDSSIVYACQVKGKIEIGSYIDNNGSISSEVVNISGLVGKLTSGKIIDCSTAVDIIYRAGKGGDIYGVVDLSGNSNALIENTYATGSLSSYISADIYAFSNGSGATIQNCYTITNINDDDYTQVANESKVYIFGTNNVSKSYYDKVALNYSFNNPNSEQNSKQKNLYGEIPDFSNSKNWLTDNNFNYGYPILKYNYLKLSSYAKQENEKKQGENGYDACILTYDYTRLPNNYTSSDYVSQSNESNNQVECYYMIPNATILNNISNGLDKNFVLIYDIDGNVNIKGEFSGKFDGQDKTISGLTDSLFEKITGKVRNLRLTDVNITNGHGALSNALERATISNITLSGEITNSTTTTNSEETTTNTKLFGSLANQAKDTQIDTITSMISINLDEYYTCVGGIIGEMTGGEISYSANYGSINIVANKNDQDNNYYIYAGGIVGVYGEESDATQVSNATIEHIISYSYNVGAITVGYGDATSSSNHSGMFYAGGIVGANESPTLTIEYSYNSGMIKSGNKSNTKKSYAAGIIAYSEGQTNINGCYNEGTIEALGANPKYEFKWENIDSKINLVLRQTNERNVYAYGIGYMSSESTITNSKVALQTNGTDISESEAIFNNGAALTKDTIISKWEWDSLKENNLQSNSSENTKDFVVYQEGAVLHWELYKAKIEVEKTIKEPTAGESVEQVYDADEKDDFCIVITSYDKLNLPRSFVLKTFREIKWYFYGEHKDRKNTGSYESHNVEGSITISESITQRQEIYDNFYYKNTIFANCNNSEVSVNDSNTAENSTCINLNGVVEDIKFLCTSQTSNSSNNQIVNIGNKQYYFVEDSNQVSIFSAGMYVVSDYFEVSTKELPYVGNSSYYTLSVNDNNISVVINKIEIDNENNKMIVYYTATSLSPITGTLNLNLNLNYSETLRFELSNMNYVYVDDNSIGIYMPTFNVSNKLLNNWKINIDNKTLSVIKLSAKNYNNEKPPDDMDSVEYIYLAYDSVNPNVLIYYPNIELTDGSKTYKVNQYKYPYGMNSIFEYDNDGKLINECASNIIGSLFSGQTYYVRYKNLSVTTQKEMNFTNSGSATKTIEGNSQSKGVTIEYGKELGNISNITDATKTSYDSSFNIKISNDIIKSENTSKYSIIYNEKELAKYEFSGNIGTNVGNWSLGPDYDNSIIVDDETYHFNLEISDNNLLLKFSNLNISSGDLENLISKIQEHIKTNFTVEAENISQNTITDFVSIVVSDKITNIDSIENIYYISFNNNQYSDSFIVRDSNNSLFSYNGSSIGKNESINSLTIGNYVFAVSIEENKIKLVNVSNEEITEDLVQKYFSGLNYIANYGSYSKTQGSLISIGTSDTIGPLNINDNKGKIGQFSVEYQYTSSKWDFVNPDDEKVAQLTENSDYSVTIELNNYSELSSYTLNGVTVYYGSKTIELIQTSEFNINNVEVENSGSDNYVVKIRINGTPIKTSIKGNGVKTVYINGYNNLSQATIACEFYSTYTLQEDDLEDFNVILKKEKKENYDIYDLKNRLIKDENNNVIRVELKSFGKLVNVKEGNSENKLMIYQSYEISGEDEIYIYSDSDNFEFLQVVKNKDETTYYLNYNSNGGLAEPIETNTLPETIYMASSNEGKTRYISKNTLNQIEKFETMQNLLIFLKTEDEESCIYLDDLSYIYCKSCDEPSIVSYITQTTYDWDAQRFSTYNTLEKQFKFYDSFVNISMSGNSVKYLVNNDGEYTIILNSINRADQIDINASREGNYNFSYVVGNQGNATSPALTIVLTNDISFNDDSLGGFSLINNNNLIGRDYFISYFGSNPFYQIISGTSYIKNVKFLGNIKNSSLLSSGDMGNLNIIDSYIFGSIVNYNRASQGAIINGNNTEGKLELNNVHININMTSFNKYDLNLFSCNNFISKNCLISGVIKAADGSNGNQNYEEDNDGEDGENGASINLWNKISTEPSTINCNAILITGNGGNASAGKESDGGVDLKTKYQQNSSEKPTQTQEEINAMKVKNTGDCAYGGEKGSINGFTVTDAKTLQTHSFNGYISLKGVKKRTGLGAFNGFYMKGHKVGWLKDDNEGKPGDAEFLIYTSITMEIKTGLTGWCGEGNTGNVTGMFNNMYNIEDTDYKQTIPSTEYGLKQEIRVENG